MKYQTPSLIIIVFGILAFSRCAENPQKTDGEALAKIQCAACHAYPSPSLLDKNSWEKYVLPRMGVMVGALPADLAEGAAPAPEGAFISREDWEAIRQFYLKNSPSEPIAAEPFSIEKALPQFEVRFPDHYLSPPGTLMTKFDGENLYLSDVHTGNLFQFDNKMVLKKTAKVPGGAVWLNRIPEGDLVTCIGSFSPTDETTGSVVFLPKKQGAPPITLLDSLRRPAHTELADLDADGRFDLVTCEFGKWAGNLSWWKNDGRGGFERHLLRNMPGAIRSEVRDLNGDGLLDITALFGQGDEGIFVYYNKGGGEFEEVRALRFPPSYGSSFFRFFDFDGDSHPDILYTCGDNADFPPVSKPYHGIHIFQNDGKNGFEEVFFQHLQGAYAAVPADFDLDGDMDIAAISFFPDFEKTPEAGFVFFENTGDLKFKARSFPAVEKGRWMVMDAADFDADGDLDLVLGSMAFEVVPDGGEVKRWVKDGIPFVVLENTAR
ncbi:MAG: VCBS repeat-containing protein [Saprospiraceae bacterium]|nr:VCBS repeat-containing protein [Saprospiraceae bacterium]MCF8250525.1 VCBS repeat-containing protein [Saprospiraceae bacterium]MCF8279665.1 VCBS repeat-containing protein [Bacteroidales bacterium]MCF8312451.1 VCBS repeat-containing protein [Saprospiraceae bacterium]MCF8440732.1 VCBS repeat-containing protein [Saprospiraceae bacterium]